MFLGDIKELVKEKELAKTRNVVRQMKSKRSPISLLMISIKQFAIKENDLMEV